MSSQTQNSSAKNPQIHIYHDLHPEDCAMLQALYSRSPASVVDHLDKVKGSGSGNFMDKYYVGYGHASIGDCGVTTLFIENYSMLAAKAIQDNPLYSGQEASTRYLDFSVQPLYDPYNHPASMAILQGWMDLYNALMPKVKAALAKKHPFDQSGKKSERVWKNAIEARAFDVLRGLLPVGTTTLLSWTTNLRQARDRLMQLQHHPLPEVQQLAQDLFKQIHAKYPHSFSGQEVDPDAERYAARNAYWQAEAETDNFVTTQQLQQRHKLTDEELAQIASGEVLADTNQLEVEALNENEQATLQNRPRGANLPRRLQAYGQYNLFFTLDFGSWRDLQRHRNGYCPLPLINGELGLFSWYQEQLAELLGDDYAAAEAQITALYAAVDELADKGVATTDLLNQYLYPMGTAMVCQLSYSLPQMIYVAELRSMQTVHASLRPLAQEMANIVAHTHPGIKLYADMGEDTWSEKRGEQTISEKPAA